MRILYLGVPIGAHCLAEHGLDPAVVCFARRQLPGKRRLRRGLPKKTLFLGRPDLESPAIQQLLKSAKPDVLLSFFWPRRIPASILALPPLGAFGVHPSLLPRWRGPDPYFWAIRAGDPITGVTLHQLGESYDTGAIAAQASIPLLENDNSWSLARRLDRPGLTLLVDLARRLEKGEVIELHAQDGRLATEAPEPLDADLAIDWQSDADEVLRLVRAAQPAPGATALFGDVLLEIVEARRYEGQVPSGLMPAEAWQSPDGWAVRCGNGAVLISLALDVDGRPADLDEALSRAQS